MIERYKNVTISMQEGVPTVHVNFMNAGRRLDLDPTAHQNLLNDLQAAFANKSIVELQQLEIQEVDIQTKLASVRSRIEELKTL